MLIKSRSVCFDFNSLQPSSCLVTWSASVTEGLFLLLHPLLRKTPSIQIIWWSEWFSFTMRWINRFVDHLLSSYRKSSCRHGLLFSSSSSSHVFIYLGTWKEKRRTEKRRLWWDFGLVQTQVCFLCSWFSLICNVLLNVSGATLHSFILRGWKMNPTGKHQKLQFLKVQKPDHMLKLHMFNFPTSQQN